MRTRNRLLLGAKPPEWNGLQVAKKTHGAMAARLDAMRLLTETTLSYSQISIATGFSPRTLAFWAVQIRKGRWRSVLHPATGQRGGRVPKLRSAVQVAVESMLKKDPLKKPREIRLWLKETQGIELSPQAMNYWINTLAGSERRKARMVARTKHGNDTSGRTKG
jgi:hypothetical protein